MSTTLQDLSHALAQLVAGADGQIVRVEGRNRLPATGVVYAHSPRRRWGGSRDRRTGAGPPLFGHWHRTTWRQSRPAARLPDDQPGLPAPEEVMATGWPDPSTFFYTVDVPVPSIYGPSADENPFAKRN